MRTNLVKALAAFTLLGSASAFANGYAVPNTNPRDLGLSGAAVANQTGPEAAYANGAALAGQDGLGISVAGTLIDFSATWTNPLGTVGQQATSTMIPKAAFPPNLNLGYGFTLGGINLAAGLAFGVPYGGLIYWPSSWPGNAKVIHVDRRIYSTDLVGAIQPIEQLKLSIGGTLYNATENLEQGLDFGTSQGDIKLGTSGTALGWNASFEATPVKDLPFRIGLQYRHQAILNLSGNAHVEGVPPTFATQGLIDSTVTHKLVVPNELEAGVSADVFKGLTIDLALTFWRWVVYQNDTFIASSGLTVVVPREYHNGMTYRLGAEYKLPFCSDLTIRTGLIRDVTGEPTDTLDPSLPTSSSWSWSVGASYQIIPQLSVTVANEYAWFDQITTTGPNAFPGTYNMYAEIASIGLTYKMK